VIVPARPCNWVGRLVRHPPPQLKEIVLKQIRKRLTYANVMSSIAVFLLLGGATAFAATKIGANQLKANSVKTGKIVKEAVTAGKIKKNAVTSSKIAAGSITTDKIANDAVTGEKANESTFGTVPSANNANATNGMHLAKINFTTGENAAPRTVFSGDGLTLTAECSGSNLEFTGTTSVDNSEIYESGNFLSTYAGGYSQDFDIGDVEEIGQEIGDGSQDEVQGQLVYSTPGGAVVTAQFSLNDSIIYGEGEGCAVEGTVEFS
jgi:hypothetical protein